MLVGTAALVARACVRVCVFARLRICAVVGDYAHGAVHTILLTAEKFAGHSTANLVIEYLITC